MNTRASALLLVLLLSSAGGAVAQERSDRFDPVTYIGTLTLFRQWTDNAFLLPPHTVRSFRDSIHANGELVAFTMTHADSMPGGWTLHMDFDPDRYGAIRLVRVYGSKTLAGDGREEFTRLDAWVQALLGRKLLDRAAEADTVTWHWMPRPEYTFTLRRLARPDGARLSLRLEATRQLPPGAERIY
jgi:hypothetical protein